MMASIATTNPSDKIVMVSNFLTSLDEVEVLVTARGLLGGCLRLDGSVPCDQRQNVVNVFNNPTDGRRVFLLSAKAGGVGLNL